MIDRGMISRSRIVGEEIDFDRDINNDNGPRTRDDRRQEQVPMLKRSVQRRRANSSPSKGHRLLHSNPSEENSNNTGQT